MKCDAIISMSGPLDDEVERCGCGCRAVQFILFSQGKLSCRCEEHQLQTQFKDVRRLTEEEALVHSTMDE
jgi:hypothetical protein